MDPPSASYSLRGHAGVHIPLTAHSHILPRVYISIYVYKHICLFIYLQKATNVATKHLKKKIIKKNENKKNFFICIYVFFFLRYERELTGSSD